MKTENMSKRNDVTWVLAASGMILWFLFFILAFPKITRAENINSESLYQYQTTLIDQHGKAIPLSVYQGSHVVITMFYASCTYSCPVLIAALKKMDNSLPADIKQKTRFLLISMDPLNDTAPLLEKVVLEQKVDVSRWKLTSPKDEKTVREIANLLGVVYRKTPDGVINHNTMINLLDANGSPVLQEEGLGESLEHVKEKLIKM